MKLITGWIICLAAVFCAATCPVNAGDAGTNETVITSSRLVYDYGRGVAVFEKDVVAVDPEVKIETDKLTVIAEGTNAVKSVTAEGNVRITTVDKKATCDRATYVAANGELVLTGNAKVSRGADVMEGDKITFWTNEDRVICEPGHMRMRLGGDMGALTGSGKREAGD